MGSLGSPLRFSCITFGSPPVISLNITQLITTSSVLSPNRGVLLAVVNEFDLVPRADQAYVRSLIDLYRSIYSLQPMMNDAIQLKNTDCLDQVDKTETSEYTLPPLFFGDTDSDTLQGEGDEMQENYWKLPMPDFHLIGEILLLRKQVINGDRPQKCLRATSILHEHFEKLLYCGLETHSRRFYGERIDLILQGRFNNQLGWENG